MASTQPNMREKLLNIAPLEYRIFRFSEHQHREAEVTSPETTEFAQPLQHRP
jgi:hypothetical protein